jgi:hypothetical protein
MSRPDIGILLRDMEIEQIVSRETDWKPLTHSTEDITLAFGRGGLKKVIPWDIASVFSMDDMVLTGCVHEHRTVRFRRNGTDVEELKDSVLFQFERVPNARSHAFNLFRLNQFIRERCWRRARVLTQRSAGRRFPDIAVIELVRPTLHRMACRRYRTLSFYWDSGFRSDLLDLSHP